MCFSRCRAQSEGVPVQKGVATLCAVLLRRVAMPVSCVSLRKMTARNAEIQMARSCETRRVDSAQEDVTVK